MEKKLIQRGDITFDVFNLIALTFAVIVVIYPLYFIVIASFSDPDAIYQGKTWLIPSGLTMEGYKRIFNDPSIWTGYKNTILYTVLGTGINLAFTLPAAYALSRKDLEGRKWITVLITFTMLFQGGLIPTYLLVKDLNMDNKIWAMVIPNAVIVWNLIVSRTFFQSTIPDELLNAAEVDGCSNFQFFFKIVMPLSKALVAIMVLYYGVNHWNAFFNALIYLRSQKLYPLQLVLRDILIQNQISDGMGISSDELSRQQRVADLIKYGVIIAASLPLLILYPFLQKYFVKGVMIGAVKG